MPPAIQSANQAAIEVAQASPVIPVAKHPGGLEHIQSIDRQLAARERGRWLWGCFTDPLFAWPFAASLTQFILG